MKTLTIKINERTKTGKSILDLLQSFPKDKKIVEILEPESPYDPKFVAKIKAREKESRGKKLTRVNPDDVWGSIL